MAKPFVIEIEQLDDHQELNFLHLALWHSGCGELSIAREPINDHWRISCHNCGGRIVISQHGRAQYEIMCLAIQQGIDFDISEYIIEGVTPCFLVSRP